jgi:hypothetical protein
MAREIQRGANTVQGVEATLWQVNSVVYEDQLMLQGNENL